jgi:hypothetical protein
MHLSWALFQIGEGSFFETCHPAVHPNTLSPWARGSDSDSVNTGSNEPMVERARPQGCFGVVTSRPATATFDLNHHEASLGGGSARSRPFHDGGQFEISRPGG